MSLNPFFVSILLLTEKFLTSSSAIGNGIDVNCVHRFGGNRESDGMPLPLESGHPVGHIRSSPRHGQYRHRTSPRGYPTPPSREHGRGRNSSREILADARPPGR